MLAVVPTATTMTIVPGVDGSLPWVDGGGLSLKVTDVTSIRAGVVVTA